MGTMEAMTTRTMITKAMESMEALAETLIRADVGEDVDGLIMYGLLLIFVHHPVQIMITKLLEDEVEA